MANPLQTGKQSVKLGAPVPGSRIRRDPPPVAKKITIRDLEERDTQTVVIGVVAFAIALFIAILGLSSAEGWSRSDEPIHLNLD